MATGSKGGLYQNAQSASYLPLTLDFELSVTIKFEGCHAKLWLHCIL